MTAQTRWSSRQLLAATLLLSGALATPLLAQTAPGTSITNQATATYSDGTSTYNATSNTVTIDVAEVAGITLQAQTPSTTAPTPGSSFTVDFVITNNGNDPTTFVIPGAATLSDSTNFSVAAIAITNVNGTPINTPVPLGAGTVQTPSIPAGGTVRVQVTVNVSASANTTATTTISLGNTTPTANLQNVPYTADAGSVFTQDNPDGTAGEYPGVLPITSEKEAMDTSALVTVSGRLQAFATILKANSAYTNNGTPSVLTDDTLTYELALRVENPTPPPTGLVVSDLDATQIKLDAGTANKVLISDVIPTGTQLSATAPTVPDPTQWTVVYSTTSLASTALQADWTTTRPTTGTITRVGFIANGAIAKGTTLRNFKFFVTPLSTFTGGRIANIAQVFGQSQPGPIVPGTATQLVYDESGDQTFNNGLDGANPDPNTTGGATITNGGMSNGAPDPQADGIDPGSGNDPTNATTNQGVNTGTTAGTKPQGGEDTIFTIAATPLNGPQGQPAAIGPTDNNDDFTNKAISPPVGLDPATLLTDAQTPDVVFTNTVQNTSSSSQIIMLLPLPPAVNTDLPDGTQVTINGTLFTYSQATGLFTTGAAAPPTVTVAAGSNQNYSVTVNLGDQAAQTKGYPVAIAAFIDTNEDGSFDPTQEAGNKTIDAVYTGYVSLLKEARILEADGTTQLVGFTTDRPTLSAAAAPGRIIEYRITYQNISSVPGSGSNNVTLPANNLMITEDGNTAPNNWFTSTKDPQFTGTGTGSAVDSTGGTINVTASGGDIQIYIDTVTTVNPGVSGTLIFRRQIK